MPIQYFCEYCRERINVGEDAPTIFTDIIGEDLVVASIYKVDVQQKVYHGACLAYILTLHGPKRKTKIRRLKIASKDG